MKNAGIVVDHPATLVTMGDLAKPEPVLAVIGFFSIAVLTARGVPGSIIISILGVTVIGVALGITENQGVVSMPPSVAPTFAQMDIAGALEIGLITIVFAFLFVDLFDTAGTLVGLAAPGRHA